MPEYQEKWNEKLFREFFFVCVSSFVDIEFGRLSFRCRKVSASSMQLHKVPTSIVFRSNNTTMLGLFYNLFSFCIFAIAMQFKSYHYKHSLQERRKRNIEIITFFSIKKCGRNTIKMNFYDAKLSVKPYLDSVVCMPPKTHTKSTFSW